jgi:hypothetical protein
MTNSIAKTAPSFAAVDPKAGLPISETTAFHKKRPVKSLHLVAEYSMQVI